MSGKSVRRPGSAEPCYTRVMRLVACHGAGKIDHETDYDEAAVSVEGVARKSWIKFHRRSMSTVKLAP